MAFDQFARFVVAGFVATAFDMAVLVCLKSLAQWNYLAANACSFLVGNVISYLICISWVFSARSLSSKSAEFTIFAIVGLAGLGVSQACMYCMVEGLSTHYLIAKTVSVGFTVGVNFLGKKLLLFRERCA
jgi:putative flippase GtrA